MKMPLCKDIKRIIRQQENVNQRTPSTDSMTKTVVVVCIINRCNQPFGDNIGRIYHLKFVIFYSRISPTSADFMLGDDQL